MADLSLTTNRPHEVEHQTLVDEIVGLRIEGLSYRAIGKRVGRSHVRCREIIDAYMSEVGEHSRDNATALLGQELERVDALVLQGMTLMEAPDTTPADKVRAAELVRRCCDTRVRWLGVSAPDRIEVAATLAEVHRGQLAGLTGEALLREAAKLGITIKGELGPG